MMQGNHLNGTGLAEQLFDPHARLNIDGLLDTAIALYNDCNFPVLKRIRNVEIFLNQYEQYIKQLSQSRINKNDFSLIKIIGRGAFGEVQLVRNVHNKKVYAMKLLDKSELIRRSEAAFFWSEREIMARAKDLTNDWIIQLHYAFQDIKYLYMVMEYMPGGDLVSLLSSTDFSEDLARFYIAELVLALDCLHGLGYIHRDVKPDNILISREGHIKLADFGTCLKMDKDGKIGSSSAAGTPDYICPEVLQSQGTERGFGREIDWWSVGICLYEMIVGETPFYSDSLIKTYQKIQNHEAELSFPDDVEISEDAQSIIRRLLTENSTRIGRDGADEIKAHPFFASPHWTFDNIQNTTPPHIPTLKSDDDTSYFDGVADSEPKPSDFLIPKAFTGSQLPFIGFTFSNDRSLFELEQPNVKTKKQFEVEISSSDNQKLNDLRSDLVNSQQLVDDLSSQLEEERARSKELKLLFAQQRSEVEEELEECQNRISVLNLQIVEERKKVESQGKKIQLLEQMIASKEKCEERLQSLDLELNELKEKNRLLVESEERAKQLQKDLFLEIEKSNDKIRATEEKLSKSRETNSKKSEHEVEINNYASEIWKLRDDKASLESNLRTVTNAKKIAEFRVQELSNQIESDQYMSNMFKMEIHAKAAELSEKDRRLQQLVDSEMQAKEIADLLEKELNAGKLYENKIRAEKASLEAELTLILQRFEDDTTTSRNNMTKMAQRESELTTTIRHLQEELQQLRKHSHGSIGFVQNGSIMTSAISTSSLASVGTNLVSSGLSTHSKSSGDLESLTKEQLIQRCQREIQLKEAVITKLEFIGKMKGISSQEVLMGKNKKKKEEVKRINDLVELKVQEHLNDFRLQEQKYIQDTQFMQQQLYEEGLKITELENELAEYRAYGTRKSPSGSDVDSASLKGRTATTTSFGVSGHRFSMISLQNATNQSFNGRKQSIHSEAQLFLAEIRLENYLQIRIEMPNKRRTSQWVKVGVQLTGACLTFSQQFPTPLIQIDTRLLHHARKVTAADIRSAATDEIPRIFQVLYDTEEPTSHQVKKNVGSKRDSVLNLTRVSNSDHSLWRRHDLIELTYHMPTTCDLCHRQLSNVFKPPPAVECQRCHMRFHAEHRDKGELPQCKHSFDTTTARDLLVMCDNEDICSHWVHTLKHVIKAMKSESNTVRETCT